MHADEQLEASSKEIVEQRRWQAAALAAAANAIVITDRSGTIVWANAAFTALTGYSLTEAIGKNPRDLVKSGQQDNAVYRDLWETIVAGRVWHGEFVNRRKDGSLYPEEQTITPVSDGAGGISHFIAVKQDLTERKRLSAEHARLVAILEATPDLVSFSDPAGKLLYFNSAGRKLLGIGPDEDVTNTAIADFIPNPATNPILTEGIPAAVRAGTWSGETILLSRSGREFPVSQVIIAHKAPTGELEFLSTIMRDISSQKLGIAALRASEQRFKALFEQAAVGVALANAATRQLVQVNQRYADILGRSREEMEELKFTDLTHAEDFAADEEFARQIHAGPLREFTREKRYRRKDGSDVWVSLTISAMWAPGDPPDYFIAVMQDIMERKQLEEQFRQAQKMEAIGILAGGIAHDFNNVLAAINGYTELSQMRLAGNPEVQKYLGAVLQASSRATDLIRQILTFSRQQRLERVPIQLQPVLQESLKLLRSTLPATIEFDLTFPNDAPTVLADATQIHQILMNLGTNAWHAMKDRAGRLQVKLERWVIDEAQAAATPRLHPGTYARVSVGDTGHGMDQATLRRIFEPFFTTKPVGEGTGLGLAVVYGIMHTHDGEVTVHSRLGEGTVFQLYFPAHAGEATVTAVEAGPVPRGHGEHVLWVDDEEVLVRLGQETLGALGYEVAVATQAEAALDLVRADPMRFALVLTDQTMPGMTGLSLASQLRRIQPDLPIILMTGYAAPLTPAQLEEAGICRVLLKPATVHALGTAVRAALAP